MDAVIVATARTPIGRAGKGSLVECRPDDLSATIVEALLAKVPALDPAEVEDVIWGTAQPAGGQSQHQSLQIHANAHGVGRAKVALHAGDAGQRRTKEIEVARHSGCVSPHARVSNTPSSRRPPPRAYSGNARTPLAAPECVAPRGRSP